MYKIPYIVRYIRGINHSIITRKILVERSQADNSKRKDEPPGRSRIPERSKGGRTAGMSMR